MLDAKSRSIFERLVEGRGYNPALVMQHVVTESVRQHGRHVLKKLDRGGTNTDLIGDAPGAGTEWTPVDPLEAGREVLGDETGAGVALPKSDAPPGDEGENDCKDDDDQERKSKKRRGGKAKKQARANETEARSYPEVPVPV